MNRTITIAVKSLTPGAVLPADLHDLHDLQGILLLKSGSRITERFIHAILARGIETVETDVEAAKSIQEGGGDQDDTGSETSQSRPPETIVPAEEVVTAGTLLLDKAIETGQLPDLPMPPHGGAAKGLLDLKSLREETAAAENRHERTVQIYGNVVSDVKDGKPIDVAGVTEIVSRMQDSVKKDTRLASLLMDFSASGGEYVQKHGLNVAWLATATATWMGLDDGLVRQVGLAAMCQDIGMLRVPESIRFADRSLTQQERALIDHHPIHTLELLERTSKIDQTGLMVAYQAHERCNRSGYPRYRHRMYIHPMTRMMAVSDVYAAVTCPRPYRDRMIPYMGMTTLLEEVKNGRLDRDYVRMFLDCFGLFPIGSYVRLSSGTAARVIRAGGREHTRPVIVPGAADGTESSEHLDLSKCDDATSSRPCPRPRPAAGLRTLIIRRGQGPIGRPDIYFVVTNQDRSDSRHRRNPRPMAI